MLVPIMALVGVAFGMDHEVYLGSHVDVQTWGQQASIGLTGQVGYRLHIGRFTLGAAGAFGSVRDPVVGLELEVGLALRPKAKVFKPWIGVETVGLVADPSDLLAWRWGASDVRLAVRPLAFHLGPVTLSALEFSVGKAEKDGSWRRTFGLNVLQIGVIH